ncbi:IclR family transcriptional regulator domain-containing protein [Streptosporangium minutum]|uniref:IclR family transcriptional regulator domain-containing protein n=1 Tax=Streptosporangium minutum TaxID=569862 RepID=UPI00241861D5|nr:IclR family transcriptional regulator C-terminal domain-containing protein [Streptosporangium minutum]
MGSGGTASPRLTRCQRSTGWLLASLIDGRRPCPDGRRPRPVRSGRSDGPGQGAGDAQGGGACIAAPVFSDGMAVAALSVSVPLVRFQPTRLAPVVKAAALGISRALARTI